MDAVKTPSIDILYEDNHLIVCIKPYNVPSQGDKSGDADMLTLLKAYIKRAYDKPGNVFLGLVHRLDRPAGGLMVFAKTTKAASRLSAAMRAHDFDKRYIARVSPAPKAMAGEWTDYLKKGAGNLVRVVKKEESGAKAATLSYRVLRVDADQSALVEVSLATGRAHQIRVQFASRGTPLVGDARYGAGGAQLRLWSAHLGFPHPTRAERMVFDAPPPSGF